MGRQVPDISPEGLAQLTQSYRDSVDREAVRIFFDGNPVDESVLIRWRESSGISKAGAARLLGMSAWGYNRVESGFYPIGEHFVGAMRKLLTQLDTEGFLFHPSDTSRSGPRFLTREEEYIPRKRIVAKLHQTKCASPVCNNWFYAINRNRLFCSRRCSNYSANHKQIDGVKTRVLKKKSEYIPLWVKCPHCEKEYPAKGHIISGTNNNPKRDSPYKTNGQANHDGEKQVQNG